MKVAPCYDGAILQKGCKAELLVEAGLIDTTCLPAGVFSGYNNTAGKKQIHTDSYRPRGLPDSKYRKNWGSIQ